MPDNIRCKDVFKHLAKNASQGNGSVIFCQSLSPFLKTGMTLAVIQSAGSLPVCKDLSKMTLMIGAISSLSSLNRRGLSLSGPAALPGFRFFRSLSSPFCEILISGMVTVESC